LIADIRDNELDVLGQHPSRCSRLPFTRLSTTRTSKPPAATSRTNSEPMNPAPPVIRTRCLDNRITPRRRLEKSESRFYQLHQCGRMPERWREISRYYRVRGSIERFVRSMWAGRSWRHPLAQLFQKPQQVR
jgi:hypothetical protein